MAQIVVDSKRLIKLKNAMHALAKPWPDEKGWPDQYTYGWDVGFGVAIGNAEDLLNDLINEVTQ
jgi:hypothetical protein